MKKKVIFIANWKMYLNFSEEINFVTSNYDNLLKLSSNTENKIILSPSMLSLATIKQILKSTNISVASQNCSVHTKGGFTGQVSAESLNSAGIDHCIIGHSETRESFKENNKEVAKKFSLLINNKISPILCIGESENDYKNDNTIGSLNNQLEDIFNLFSENLNIPNYIPIYIAYEPIWSIGTGKIASNNHLENIFAWLYDKTQKQNNKINFNLLYGGSVNSENVKSLIRISHLNGFLIGKASLNFQEFKKIVNSTKA